MANPMDDPYADGAPSPNQAEPDGDEAKGDNSPTELLSKSFFQGKDLQVGGICEIKIAAIHNNQVSVSYVPHGEEESEEEPQPEPSMPVPTQADQGGLENYG